MGGQGSGRHGHDDAKETTDHYRWVDVRRWQRDGLLTAGRIFVWQWLRQGEAVASILVLTEPDRVILAYRHQRRGREAWQDERYSVRLEWTPCNLGGVRAWFRCPVANCGRRVAILYGGAIFACRHCQNLAYPSQREADYDRAMRRVDRIRERLGWRPGMLNSRGGKPKGMHWQTFRRLSTEHNEFLCAALTAMLQRF